MSQLSKLPALSNLKIQVMDWLVLAPLASPLQLVIHLKSLVEVKPY